LSGLQADFSGAIKKMNSALKIPQAVRYQATRWGTETVFALKASAGTMQKSIGPLHKKSSQLARATSMKVSGTSSGFQLGVGTGYGTINVKYAKIQDEGGTTHPTVTDRMRRWAWYAYGVQTGFQRKMLKREVGGISGAKAQRLGRLSASKYLGIALTKKARLDVHIPASGWFTRVIEYREPYLYAYMSPSVIYARAQEMRGGK
jgi:hypothetical protein